MARDDGRAGGPRAAGHDHAGVPRAGDGADEAALGAGALSCSGGERRILELAASLAGHHPVILGDAVTGLDHRSTRTLVKAVLHASGQRQFL